MPWSWPGAGSVGWDVDGLVDGAGDVVAGADVLEVGVGLLDVDVGAGVVGAEVDVVGAGVVDVDVDVVGAGVVVVDVGAGVVVVEVGAGVDAPTLIVPTVVFAPLAGAQLMCRMKPVSVVCVVVKLPADTVTVVGEDGAVSAVP